MSIKRQTIEEIVRRADIEVFTDKKRSQLGELSERFDSAHKRLGEVTNDRMHHEWQAQMSQHEREVAAGQAPGLIPSREEAQKAATAQRFQIREELYEAAWQVHGFMLSRRSRST